MVMMMTMVITMMMTTMMMLTIVGNTVVAGGYWCMKLWSICANLGWKKVDVMMVMMIVISNNIISNYTIIIIIVETMNVTEKVHYVVQPWTKDVVTEVKGTSFSAPTQRVLWSSC